MCGSLLTPERDSLRVAIPIIVVPWNQGKQIFIWFKEIPTYLLVCVLFLEDLFGLHDDWHKRKEK